LRCSRPAPLQALCPFHNDTRPSLQVDPRWAELSSVGPAAKAATVFEFVMGMEKVQFPRSARNPRPPGQTSVLDGEPGPNLARLKLLDAMRWAETAYRECLVDSSWPSKPRLYLGERRLDGSVVRNFGLGFARRQETG